MIIAILRKPQRHRTERDLQRLLPLVKTIKFFRDFLSMETVAANDQAESDRNLREIVSCLTYEFLPKECNVFEYGKRSTFTHSILESRGDKFYILLDGEVRVLVPR